MPNPTKQDVAVNAANSLVNLMEQFKSLYHAAQDLSARFTDNDLLTVLNALPTAPWAADGSIGTADGTPNTQHPITTQSLYLPANDVTGGVYLINDFVAFMSNGTVSQSDRNSTVAKLVR